MGIKENIKLLREKYNLSQKDLAIIAGVTDKAVSTWESGAKEPRMGAIQKMADHFGLKKSNIIEDDGLNAPSTPITLTPPEEIHIKKYRQLDDDGKEEIDNMIDFKLKKTETKQKNKSRILTLEPAEPADVIANCVEQIRPRKTGS